MYEGIVGYVGWWVGGGGKKKGGLIADRLGWGLSGVFFMTWGGGSGGDPARPKGGQE